MKKIRVLGLFLSLVTMVTTLSYSPVNDNVKSNKKAIIDAVTSMVIEKEIQKRAYLIEGDPIEIKRTLEIENQKELTTFLDSIDINQTTFTDSVTDVKCDFEDEEAVVEMKDQKVEIVDYTSSSYHFVDERASENYSYIMFKNDSYREIKKADSYNVSFSGINVSAKICKKIYEGCLSFTDKVVNKYGPIGIIYNVMKYTMPVFTAQISAVLASLADKITTYLQALGPWAIAVKIAAVVFAAIIGVIIGSIIYAGAHGKGFKMGLEWRGWFKCSWVYQMV